MSRSLLLGFVCLLTLNLPQVLASLLAIDYGSEWIKASLMKPGVPFDVLLNKDSKRKIQSSVGWKNDDRLFGSDAYNLVSNPKPVSGFLRDKLCTGHEISNRFVQLPQIPPGCSF